MSDNEYWDEATERAYWDACAEEEAAMLEKDNELIPRGEARKLAYEIFNHFMLTDFLLITPTDIDEKVDAITAVPHEMSAREYLREFVRMCKANKNADGLVCRAECPMLDALKGAIYRCKVWVYYHPDEAVAIVEKWMREHPERSGE